VRNSPHSSSSSAPLAAFFGPDDGLARVYGEGRREQVLASAHAHGFGWVGEPVGGADFETRRGELEAVQVIFSTWGMPALTEEQIGAMPSLRAVFYAAGSVQNFARPFLARGITVVSAWAANAVPVAEWTLAQILLSNKGFWRNERDASSPTTRPRAFAGPGNFQTPVALLGAGMIGRSVISLLRPFQVQVLVFDPFLPDEEAAQLGVQKVSLEEAFAHGNVVSNHVANVPGTRRMLRGTHFSSMAPNTTFINTGRGATIAEDELIAVLRERPDLTALLDVTDPEPPQPDSPLYDLPNVRLTSHIAGSTGREVVRMADFALEEFEAWAQGKPLRYAVSAAMLETMA
jgi:phosphoglycerate dehydrogenase-like enzyme